ncbi:MAG: hypothetical protein K0R18_1021 [Bacillales bacterium]|jgi:RNA polymerase sigma factor (sigma-70 family)|nr:hypothetical protein [Bacillales bacterium]
MTNKPNEAVLDNIDVDKLNTLDAVIFEDFKNNLESGDLDLKEVKAETSKAYLEQAVYDYLNGEDTAFDYIYDHYRPVLERLAYRKNDEDLAQELSIVLYHAVQKFDILAGVKFNTFFWTCAQNHIGTQNIRKNAQKRSGAQKVEKTVINEETGEEEVIMEVIKTKVISLQTTLKNKESETEIGNFVESDYAKADYKKANLKVALEQLLELKLISEDEKLAIELIGDGDTLAEIGAKLGGITAPAVHVKLRRLGKRKQVAPILKEILIGL